MTRNIVLAAFGAALMLAAGFAAGNVRAADAPKAYVVGEVDITDPVGYKAYLAAASPIAEKFGGVYMARGGRTVTIEGAPPAQRVILIQFPNLAAAEAFEKSSEYLKVAPLRQRASTGRFFLVEGL